MALTVGFIGFGIMGSRMADNLQTRGYKLIVFNRTRHKAGSSPATRRHLAQLTGRNVVHSASF